MRRNSRFLIIIGIFLAGACYVIYNYLTTWDLLAQESIPVENINHNLILFSSLDSLIKQTDYIVTAVVTGEQEKDRYEYTDIIKTTVIVKKIIRWKSPAKTQSITIVQSPSSRALLKKGENVLLFLEKSPVIKKGNFFSIKGDFQGQFELIDRIFYKRITPSVNYDIKLNSDIKKIKNLRELTNRIVKAGIDKDMAAVDRKKWEEDKLKRELDSFPLQKISPKRQEYDETVNGHTYHVISGFCSKDVGTRTWLGGEPFDKNFYEAIRTRLYSNTRINKFMYFIQLLNDENKAIAVSYEGPCADINGITFGKVVKADYHSFTLDGGKTYEMIRQANNFKPPVYYAEENEGGGINGPEHSFNPADFPKDMVVGIEFSNGTEAIKSVTRYCKVK